MSDRKKNIEFAAYRDTNGETHLLNLSEIDYVSFTIDEKFCKVVFNGGNKLEFPISTPVEIGNILVSGSIKITSDIANLSPNDTRNVSLYENGLAFELAQDHARNAILLSDFEFKLMWEIQQANADKQNIEVWKIDTLYTLHKEHYNK